MMKISFVILLIVLFSFLKADDSGFQKNTFDRQLKACDEGEPFSCLRVGDAYYTGRGMKKDISSAEDFYAKGAELMKARCDKGETAHCTYYAGMLQVGKGVEKNVEKAYEIYHDLCNKMDCESCGRLYFLSARGDIPSDSHQLICSEPFYIY